MSQVPAFITTTLSYNFFRTSNALSRHRHCSSHPIRYTISPVSVVDGGTAYSHGVFNSTQLDTIKTASSVNAPSPASAVTTMEQFWDLADESQLNAQYLADHKIEFLKHASPDEVRRICVQYRYFVAKYPNNLAHLVQKLPNEQLKSFLAEVLSEELGSGDVSASHITWYDSFLRSIGVTEEELENSLYEENGAILAEIERRCNTQPFQQLVGMIGMGRECLCQIYLTNMHKYLIQNEYITGLGDKVDWCFWTFHVGEDDIEHRMEMRKTIDEMVIDSAGVQQLAEGYRYGKESWDMFWTNNYKGTGAAANN